MKSIVMHENMGSAEEPSSMEHVKKSELFPKKQLVSDDEGLRVPFPLLSGEAAEFLGRTADGIIVLSNFRLLIRNKDSFMNIPLGLIESVEIREIFYLTAYCKDATVVRCAFSTNETCQDWFKRLSTKAAQPKDLNQMFAFAFHAWCVDRNPCPEPVLESCYQLCPADGKNPYSFTKEIERMKFDLKNAWRYTEINSKFELCSTYPQEHIVPKGVKDEDLKKVAGYRAIQRFPSVVWRNCKNGAVLVRSSQPELGWFGWRNTDDETLLSAIPLACAMNPGTANKHSRCHDDGSGSESSSQDEDSTPENSIDPVEPKKMLIIDCRSYGAAVANRAKGGGVECPEYYPMCEIQFMNLANIHTVRKSFVALRALCSGVTDQASWLSGLENTKWLHHLSSLLKAAGLVVSVNDKEGRPVLVHCSDGWDRTPQIISLAELMLDPYYRTVEGFQVLVEREWLDFGHKFADRCGSGICTEDVNERCPVFLQWLECVHQIQREFPCQFEFNEAFLVKLLQHTYSCLFGTFLCNTKQERLANNLEISTASVWSLLSDRKFYNHLYSPTADQKVLYPAFHVKSLNLWASVYLSYNFSSMSAEEAVGQQQQVVTMTESGEPSNLQKARSCENLLSLADHPASPSRRKSDPNIALDTSIGDQAAKLLKEAMSSQDGDTSCSGESTRSSENVSVNGHIDRQPSPDSVASGVSEENEDNVRNGVENGESHSESKCNGDVMNGEVVPNGDVTESGASEVHHASNGINGAESGDDTENGDSVVANGQYDNGKDFDGDSSLDRGESDTDDSSDNLIPSSAVRSNGSLCSSVSTETVTDTLNGTTDITSKVISRSSKEQLVTYSKSSTHSLPSIESSTDTIIDEEGNLVNGTSKHSLPRAEDNGYNYEHCLDLNQALCDKDAVNKLKTIERTSSISTSTSDLTDSHVSGSSSAVSAQESLHKHLKLRCVLAQAAACNGDVTVNGCSKSPLSGSYPATTPQFPSPISPESRNSTCPPTPGTSEGKSLDTPVQRQLSGVGRQLDVDGLTMFVDPVQQRIQNIQTKYEQEVASLQHRVAYLESLLRQHASACNGEARCNLEIKVGNGNESPGNSEMHSLQSNCSNAASDASWDQMEDPEINVALWVPDYMVTHCADCDAEFSMLKRKHHCRNCGKIFCHQCCKEYMPLPHQMVHTAERVCRPCSRMLGLQLTKSVMEFDNGISEQPAMAAAASN